MTNIFDYMGKNEEMIHYLESALNYLDNIYEAEIKTKTYKSNITIFYQMYTFVIISTIRSYIKKYSDNIRNNEYNIIKFPKLDKFNDIIQESSYDILNILNLYDFIELTLDCLVRNNIFVFVTKEELNDICEILEKCLLIIDSASV